MSLILAALHRALNRRADSNVPVPVFLAPTPPVFLPVVPVDPWTNPPVNLDDLMRSIGPYAADPRISTITARQIRLVDGRTIDQITDPDVDLYMPSLACDPYPAKPLRGQVWRMFRPDQTASAFWWLELVDALTEILGPAQAPTFLTSLETS